MFLLYMVSLGIGGTLLATSLLLGGGHDHDVDTEADGELHLHLETDLDADLEVDADADADGDGQHDLVATDGVDVLDAILAWFPFTSMRFWTFFLAFFGLTGAVFVLFKLHASASVVAAIAGAIGYGSGISVVTTMRRLNANQTDSNVRLNDYIGATGTAMLGVGPGKTGKIRLQLKGRAVEMMAITEEDTEINIKDKVMVYGITADGRAIVTRPEDADA